MIINNNKIIELLLKKEEEEEVSLSNTELQNSIDEPLYFL